MLVNVIGGALQPGYSQVRNFISELEVTGTPYGEAISMFGFLPVGC